MSTRSDRNHYLSLADLEAPLLEGVFDHIVSHDEVKYWMEKILRAQEPVHIPPPPYRGEYAKPLAGRALTSPYIRSIRLPPAQPIAS